MTNQVHKPLGTFAKLMNTSPTPEQKKAENPEVQKPSKEVRKDLPHKEKMQQDKTKTLPEALPINSDTSLLTTKEKTKYGTYLTDETIEKIGMRAIQLKRDAHQVVQEAINKYFEWLEK